MWDYQRLDQQITIRPEVKFKTKGSKKFAELVRPDFGESGVGSDTMKDNFAQFDISGSANRNEQPRKLPEARQETPFLDEMVGQFKAADFGKSGDSGSSQANKPGDRVLGSNGLQSADPFASFNGQSLGGPSGRASESDRVLEKIMSPGFLNLGSEYGRDMKTPFD